MTGTASQRVVCPPEKFIAAASSDILQELQYSFPDNSADLQELFKLLEGTSHVEYQSVSRRIKNNFRIFSAAASGRSLPTGRHADAVTDNVLDRQELQFLDDFQEVMQSAHYRLITQDEWDTALAEEFTFSMPVEVRWGIFDGSLLRRYWSQRVDQRSRAADITDKILVFHRGVKTVRAQGSYIMDKIDLLTGYLIWNPLSELLGKVMGAQAQSQAEKFSPMTNASETRPQEVQLATQNTRARRGSLEHANAKVVQRVTLQAIMPDAASVIKNIFRTLTIQEPTFKDVVILYRRQPDAGGGSDEKDPKAEFNQDLARRNMVIKHFEDIPMADAEMIFPDKRVYIKPFILIQLAVTVVLAIVTVFSTLLQNKVSMSLMGTLASAVLGRAYQVYYSATLTKQRIQDEMTRRLYEKTLNAQEAVIADLLDEMAEQRLKEELLAYVLLLMHGNPHLDPAVVIDLGQLLTASGTRHCGGDQTSMTNLDHRCEVWLSKTFGLYLDFAIESTLPTLVEEGLIQEHKSGNEVLLQAQPLSEALQTLHRKWSRLGRDKQEDSEQANLAAQHQPPSGGPEGQGEELQAGAPAQHMPAASSLPVQASNNEQGSQDQLAVPPSSTSDSSGSVTKKASSMFGKLLHPHHHKTT